MLTQIQSGTEKVIAYGSRSLSKCERRYCTTRKKLLAIVYFTEYFRHYLLGRPFEVRTDHNAIRWIFTFKNPEGQMARWLEMLSRFDFKVIHRPGKLHGNADALSRRPCDPSDCNCWEGDDVLGSLGCGPCKHCIHSNIKFGDTVSVNRVQQSVKDTSTVYRLWTFLLFYLLIIRSAFQKGWISRNQAGGEW